ncbi:Uncharacterised protein [Shigella sonnei]|nr:Uncharacterised protein [Shigella sonnei]
MAARNGTSAAMMVQLKYAPQTETIKPAAMMISPHGPIISTIRPAIDGLRISASSGRATTPSESSVTSK